MNFTYLDTNGVYNERSTIEIFTSQINIWLTDIAYPEGLNITLPELLEFIQDPSKVSYAVSLMFKTDIDKHSTPAIKKIFKDKSDEVSQLITDSFKEVLGLSFGLKFEEMHLLVGKSLDRAFLIANGSHLSLIEGEFKVKPSFWSEVDKKYTSTATETGHELMKKLSDIVTAIKQVNAITAGIHHPIKIESPLLNLIGGVRQDIIIQTKWEQIRANKP